MTDFSYIYSILSFLVLSFIVVLSSYYILSCSVTSMLLCFKNLQKLIKNKLYPKVRIWLIVDNIIYSLSSAGIHCPDGNFALVANATMTCSAIRERTPTTSSNDKLFGTLGKVVLAGLDTCNMYWPLQKHCEQYFQWHPHYIYTLSITRTICWNIAN